MEIEIRPHGWYCPKCKKFNSVRAIYRSGDYERKCRCGFRVMLEVYMKEVCEWRIDIQSAEQVNA